MTNLNNRVAVVTGGSSGIGRATAKLLARHGARVFTGDFKPRPENAESFAELGITELVCDVRSEAQVHALLERAVAGSGSLQIVVSNAGIDLEVQVPLVSEAQWDACLDTNLKGSFFVAKHSIPHLRLPAAARWFLRPATPVCCRAHDPVYCVSKAALNALSNSLALCHAPDRIRFNTVCPGPVADTGLIEAWLATVANREAMVQQVIEASPLARAYGRMITPDEVAEAILYLVSDAAALVTGTALRIDGGKSLGVPPRA